MDILFIHPNFIGQFRRLAEALAKEPEYNVYGMGELQHCKEDVENITTITYPNIEEVSEEVHRYNRPMERAIRRAEKVCSVLLERKRKDGFEPDIIFVHPGWGDAFYLKEIFPLTPVVGFFEFFYHSRGKDVGFDPEFPMYFDDIFRLKALNSVHMLSLESCDVRISPTQWQKSLFPNVYQDSIEVIHEGIDTDTLKPDTSASVKLPNAKIVHAGDEVLTYVARGLEPYRGYHQFMRSLPKVLQSRPECEVIIVGSDDVSYGKKAPDDKTYRHIYFEEIEDKVDTTRIHFMGVLEYEAYLKVLQVSRCHVYLTYPFVLSWSALEALSSGCVVVGSDTPPVTEVIRDGENGVLVDFFDTDAISNKIIDVLSNTESYTHISNNARKYAQEQFDFQNVSFKAYKTLIDKLTL